jgi:hypothetical protein
VYTHLILVTEQVSDWESYSEDEDDKATHADHPPTHGSTTAPPKEETHQSIAKKSRTSSMEAKKSGAKSVPTGQRSLLSFFKK